MYLVKLLWTHESPDMEFEAINEVSCMKYTCLHSLSTITWCLEFLQSRLHVAPHCLIELHLFNDPQNCSAFSLAS